ncbi:ATP-dependent zinc metalloprotease FtsH [Ihuprevotella massiliensis]|uniref:ATP-dependent zinc metalloprotease FtsH n=1 Tax=Ihuprevotella massiliensis TaxID=1852368 RepID=UPI00094EF3CF
MSQLNPQQPQKPKMPRFNLNWLYFIIIAALGIILWQGNSHPGSATKEVSYSDIKTYIAKGYTNKVVVDKTDGVVEITILPEKAREVFGQSVQQLGKSPSVSSQYPSTDKVEDYLNSVNFKGKITYEQNDSFFLKILSSFLPLLILIGFWWFILRGAGGGRGGGIFSVGKSKAKEYNKDNAVQVLFKDVAGQEGAKQEVQEIVDFLKNPAKYTELGGKIPKGALLVGPPGTGKTLLAKAVAGEAGVPFFSMSGSDFVEMFVGVGASRVRDLFKKAKEKAPSIVFIDEIDAVGRARSKGASFGGNDERENTLNQLLTEMDGFGTNSGVIILAATNRVDVLDKALLRAGRFDRQIHVDLPDLTERIAIFHVHLAPLKLQPGLDIELLARQTPGFSGADIANVCNEAALIAARHDRESVTKQDFLDAVDRIIGGLEKRTKVMTQEEKRAIAIHEAGHASVSWLIEHANPLIKVTIVPRGQSLGAAWYLPEERSITTKEQMLDEICATLAGRAAEEVFLGRISSGALNDLERVTQRAYGMIAYLGMGEGLPNLSYYSNQEQFTKPYSEETARRIDHEVQQLINVQYERAKQLLRENAAKHNELADLLCEHEVIFAADVENIFGPRPWKSRADVILEESPEEAAKLAVLTSSEKDTDEEKVADTPPTPASTDVPVHPSDTEEASESLPYQAPTTQEQQ